MTHLSKTKISIYIIRVKEIMNHNSSFTVHDKICTNMWIYQKIRKKKVGIQLPITRALSFKFSN